MKNLFLAIICLTTLGLNAQDTTKTEVKAGFMFAPQGGLSLKDIKKNSETFYPVFIVMPITKGKWCFTPFYNMTSKSSGATAEYALSSKCGMYIVGSKNVNVGGGYAGYGIDTPVLNDLAYGFVEFGSSWDKWDPYIYAGVFIPFTRKLTK